MLGEFDRHQVMTAQHMQPIGQWNPLLLSLFRSFPAANNVGSLSPAVQWRAIELYPESGCETFSASAMRSKPMSSVDR